MVKPPNRSEYGGVAYNETITAGKGKANTQATIFIVDDGQAIGEMLSLVLENKGFHTVTCMDGLRAVDVPPRSSRT